LKKYQKLKYVALTCVIALMLTSCSARAKYTVDKLWNIVRADALLVASEFDDVVDFVVNWDTVGKSVAKTVAALPMENDVHLFPILNKKIRTAVLDSPYNRWDSDATAASCGPEVVLNEDRYDVPEHEDIFGCAKIPRFDDRSLAVVEGILNSFGVKTEVVVRANTAPTGEVFAMTYAGTTDADNYYVNPGVAVTLYVSADKPVPEITDPSKVVYLTYDDGPTKNDTSRLLDVLDTYGVKAAFFTVGDIIKKHPDSACAVVDRGHYLGCHSVTHDYGKIYASTEALQEEIVEWEEIVREAGIELNKKLFRFPGGSVGSNIGANMRSEMMDMVQRMGYLVFDWNVVTNDALLYLRPDDMTAKGYIKDTFITTFDTRVRMNESGNTAPIIILMHETVDETIDLMPWMIEYLIDNGYTFGDPADLEESWMFSADQ